MRGKVKSSGFYLRRQENSVARRRQIADNAGMSHSAPKKCATCGKTAQVFVSYVAGGKVSNQAWCKHHAAAEGLAGLQGYALIEAGDAAETRRGDSTLRCPGCDSSQRDFERQGRFGCSVCYTTFAGLLPTLLNRMHRDVTHRGKIPLRGADPAVMRHRLARLQTELSKAVRAEQFEGAATTRDAIETLKAKLLAPGLPPDGVQTPGAHPPSS